MHDISVLGRYSLETQVKDRKNGKKCLKKSCPSNMVLYAVFINSDPIGQNHKCLKRNFGKGHIRPIKYGPDM